LWVLEPAGLFYLLNLMALLTYLKHVREEMGHIVWPSNRTALAHTLVVILIALAIAVIVGVLDYLFAGIVGKLTGAY
jgi:preprotein translocase SecE subunit